jgi:cobalt-zinc-cadmium efflux system membrane fusion protein
MSISTSQFGGADIRTWAKRHRHALLFALIGATLLAGGGRMCWPVGTARAAHGSGAPAPGSFRLSDEQLRSMSIEPVVTQRFHSESITDGRIAYNADTLTAVYSPYSGRVTRLVAALGAVVRRGQPLFEVQASEYAQDESDLLTAVAQVKLSTATERRRHAQYEAHGGSLQDWQQAQNDLAAAQANLAAVRNRLRILGRSEAQIDAVESGAHPKAEVAAVAPISGVVVDRQLGPGQYLQAGASTPVYTIADLSSVWMVANVREADATRVHVGQSVVVRVLALPDRVFTGKLDYVAAAVDPVSRRLPVHAVLDNGERLLKPEMFATFTIATSPDILAPAVPQEAVIFEGAQARAWVMQNEHDAALRPLTLGRELDGKYEVLQGLSTGERVITRGALFIDRAASGG